MSLALLLGPAQADEPAPPAVPLQDILHALTRSGVRLIFSSETVPRELRAIPPSSDLPIEERLQRLLAPFRLAAQRLADGTYVIVHAAQEIGSLEVTVTLERDGLIKPLVGSWGRLIVELPDRRAAEGVFEYAAALPGPQSHLLYVQELIAKPGRDVRAEMDA